MGHGSSVSGNPTTMTDAQEYDSFYAPQKNRWNKVENYVKI